MFKFLIMMFFLFLLLIFLLGFSMFRAFKNMLFGKGNNIRTERRDTASGRRSTSGSNEYQNSSTRRRRKIFGKDEGEYVDYEEVK